MVLAIAEPKGESLDSCWAETDAPLMWFPGASDTWMATARFLFCITYSNNDNYMSHLAKLLEVEEGVAAEYYRSYSFLLVHLPLLNWEGL